MGNRKRQRKRLVMKPKHHSKSKAARAAAVEKSGERKQPEKGGKGATKMVRRKGLRGREKNI